VVYYKAEDSMVCGKQCSGFQIRDPGSIVFLTPGSGIENLISGFWVKNTYILWCGSRILSTLDPGSGMEKIGSGNLNSGSWIGDKHTGSATLAANTSPINLFYRRVPCRRMGFKSWCTASCHGSGNPFGDTSTELFMRWMLQYINRMLQSEYHTAAE
jgi:hypothetical protein